VADRRLARKKLVVRFGTKDHDTGTVVLVLGRHQSSLLDMERAEVLVFRPYPSNGTAGRIPVADFADRMD
jgi:hypothetical protein